VKRCVGASFIVVAAADVCLELIWLKC